MFSLYLHDAVYMCALATDELFREGGDKRNGSRIFEIAKNKTFHGKPVEDLKGHKGCALLSLWIKISLFSCSFQKKLVK